MNARTLVRHPFVADLVGAAAAAGIRPGVVVLSADGSTLHSAGDRKAAVAGSKKHVALLVRRGEARVFVPVDLG